MISGNDRCYEDDEMGYYDRKWLRGRFVWGGGAEAVPKEWGAGSHEETVGKAFPVEGIASAKALSWELPGLPEEQKEGLHHWVRVNGEKSGRRWGWEGEKKILFPENRWAFRGFSGGKLYLHILEWLLLAVVWKMHSLLGGKSRDNGGHDREKEKEL